MKTSSVVKIYQAFPLSPSETMCSALAGLPDENCTALRQFFAK